MIQIRKKSARVVREEEGWRVIYGAHEREEVQILNTELDQLSEPEEVKRAFSEQALLEFISLACGCCPGIRRASLLSYLDREFRSTFKVEVRFITYDCK